MTSRRLRERRISRAIARADKPVATDPLQKFADKAYDLYLMQKSVDRAARVSGGLWLSYLFALFYIGIAAGGITHKDLLLENPARLPFLNVELPLVAFFALAPVLFVVSHAYTLMHFVLLAAKAGAFNAELKRQIREPDNLSADIPGDEPALDHREIRGGLRRQLPSNIFVQFLAGPLDIREGGLGWLLKAIAWISLVIGPVLLLLLIQVQFLPYHLEWVTWVQRLAVLVDVVLLWFLWPAVLDGRSEIRWPRLWRHPIAAVVSLVPIALAFVVARYPGEWVDHQVGNMRWIPPYPRQARHEAEDGQGYVTAWFGQPGWTSVHDLLFNGDVDEVTRRRKSLFSNTLVLPEFDGLAAAKIDDPNKLDSDGIRHSLVLRGRHLKGAVLSRADLRKVDFESAKLEGANLVGARLQGASLVSANLEGAVLDDAQLRGALLHHAKLKGARLDHAQLQGANLAYAELEGASLVEAKLPIASLDDARLQGASLQKAQLQGARLERARLQGASLDDAGLQWARMEKAQLQGASLVGAQLQGSNFTGSKLFATDMSGAAVWRASFADVSSSNVLEEGFDEGALSRKAFDTLESVIEEETPAGKAGKTLLETLASLNPAYFGPEANLSETLKRGRVGEAAYRKALADELTMLTCSSGDSAPFILRGLVRNGRLVATGPFAPALVERILSPDCPASADLTAVDKAELRSLGATVKSGDRLSTDARIR